LPSLFNPAARFSLEEIDSFSNLESFPARLEKKEFACPTDKPLAPFRIKTIFMVDLEGWAMIGR
jgi:hypothetical protein